MNEMCISSAGLLYASFNIWNACLSCLLSNANALEENEHRPGGADPKDPPVTMCKPTDWVEGFLKSEQT